MLPLIGTWCRISYLCVSGFFEESTATPILTDVLGVVSTPQRSDLSAHKTRDGKTRELSYLVIQNQQVTQSTRLVATGGSHRVRIPGRQGHSSCGKPTGTGFLTGNSGPRSDKGPGGRQSEGTGGSGEPDGSFTEKRHGGRPASPPRGPGPGAHSVTGPRDAERRAEDC